MGRRKRGVYIVSPLGNCRAVSLTWLHQLYYSFAKTFIDILSSLSPHASPSPTPVLPLSSSSPNHPAISSPAPLSLKRANVNSPAPSSLRHRKSRPDPLSPPSPSTPSFDRYDDAPPAASSTRTRLARREPMSPTWCHRVQLGKCSSSGTHRDQPPSSPSSPRHKIPSSSRIRSPLPRVVLPRDFISTLTYSLNYRSLHSSNAIQRSSVDRRSPTLASPSTPSRPRAQQRQRIVSSSSAMAYQLNPRLPRRSHSSVLQIPFAAKPSARPLRCSARRY